MLADVVFGILGAIRADRSILTEMMYISKEQESHSITDANFQVLGF